MYIFFYLFIHYRHLGFLYDVVISSSAAVSVGMQVCLLCADFECFISFQFYTRMVQYKQMVVQFLVLWGTAIVISIMAILIFIPKCEWLIYSSVLSHSHQHLFVVFLMLAIHFSQSEMECQCSFYLYLFVT